MPQQAWPSPVRCLTTPPQQMKNAELYRPQPTDLRKQCMCIKMARQPLFGVSNYMHADVNSGLDLKRAISQVINYGGTCIY